MASDSQHFLQSVTDLAKFIVSYREGLVNRQIPVQSDLKQIKPGYLRALVPDHAPEQAEEYADVMKDFHEKIMPGMTHWQHPNFHGYYPTCSTYPSMLGDLLSLAVAPIGLTWLACPACTELEVITMDWMARAMGLPEKFLSTKDQSGDTVQVNGNVLKSGNGGGTIECSASVAFTTVTLAARACKVKQLGENGSGYTEEQLLLGCGPGALVDRMVGYSSDQAHGCVTRAYRVAMLQHRQIESRLEGKKRIFDATQLRQTIQEDQRKGFIPCIVIATIGTTATCEFDDIEAIGRVCREYNILFYVDAAYAGNALICPEYRHWAKGLEYADAFCVNGNKLMRVNFDSTFLWIADQELLYEALHTEPAYLRHSFQGMPEYRNWSLSLGRRFRALKLWFVLRMFGLEELRSYIREHVRQADYFKALLDRDDRFEIINDVRFGLVCFRLKGENAQTKKLYQRLLLDNRMFLVSCKVNEPVGEENQKYFLRFVASPSTRPKDVDLTYQVLTENLEK